MASVNNEMAAYAASGASAVRARGAISEAGKLMVSRSAKAIDRLRAAWPDIESAASTSYAGMRIFHGEASRSRARR